MRSCPASCPFLPPVTIFFPDIVGRLHTAAAGADARQPVHALRSPRLVLRHLPRERGGAGSAPGERPEDGKGQGPGRGWGLGAGPKPDRGIGWVGLVLGLEAGLEAGPGAGAGLGTKAAAPSLEPSAAHPQVRR